MKLPKSVTVFGLVVALAAVVIDPANQPWLVTLLGDHAATKLAAVGAILSSMGRAVFATTPAPTPTPPPAP